MFSDVNVFKVASALAQHTSARQSVISQNVANADTPGYKAKDLLSFKEAYNDKSVPFSMKATRPNHIVFQEDKWTVSQVEVERPGDESPNGNSVSVEVEMMSAAEVKFSHDLALTVYRSGLSVLRSGLGRR